MASPLALRKLLAPSLMTCALLLPSSSFASTSTSTTSGVVVDTVDEARIARRKKKRKIRYRKKKGSSAKKEDEKKKAEEAAAKKAAEEAAAKKAAEEKAAQEKAAQKKAAQEKAAQEQAAKKKAAADQAAKQKAAGKTTTEAPDAAVADAAPVDDKAAPIDKTGGGKYKDPDVLLKKAFTLYNDLEYDLVIPLAKEVLANPFADVQNQLDAYLLQGSCLAIVGDPIEAEKPFRFLLRGRPDYDMPADTPPKILAVFRKVQVEERAIIETTRELERQRVIASLQIEDKAIEDATGGVPIVFDIGLRDPRGAVGQVRVFYRRQGDEAFVSLPLQLAPSGRWIGEVPGSWSENEDGFTFEYYVTTFDREGSLLIAQGDETAPKTTSVAPGFVADAVPFYETVWFWGTVGAAGAVVIGSGAALGIVASMPPITDLGTVSID